MLRASLSSCLFLLCLLFVASNLLAQTTPKSVIYDVSQKLPSDILGQLRADIARLDTRNVPVYLFVGSESVPFSEYAKIVSMKEKEYDLVLGIIWSAQAGGYGPVSGLREELDNDLLLTSGENAFYQALTDYCNGCTSLTGLQAGQILRAGVQEILGRLVLEEAAAATGAMNHFRRHRKYLPLDPALGAQIELFGERIERHLDKWAVARRIYTSAEAADTFTYSNYRQRVLAFAEAMEAEINTFKQDFEQSSQFPGMYLLGKDSRYFDKQSVHLRQIGSYVGNPMYYRRAHDKMRAVLSTGRIRAALKEFAALENTYAYHKLYDLYIWLDQEDWLAFDQGGKAGDRRSVQRDNNNYKFNTLADFSGDIAGIDLGILSAGAGHQHELFLLQFDHNFLPLEYDMFIGCSSAYTSASLGGSASITPGLDDFPSASGVMPQGDNINNASRSHVFHFPANFFAGGTLYSYKGASTGADLGPANYTYVLAGDMTFSKAGLDFTIGTAGHNVTLTGTNNEVGVTILESAAGAGGCFGTAIHNFTGLAQSLEVLPERAMENDSTRLAAYMMPMIESQADLSTLNKEYLDHLVEDLKTLHAEFPERGATVQLLGGAAGIWSLSGSPITFSGDAKQLVGLDIVSYLNSETVKNMVTAAETYLTTELAKTQIPPNKYLITSGIAFRNPIQHQDFVGRNMGGDYIDVRTEPTGWRLVLATVRAEL